MSIMHIECTLVFLYASHSYGSRIGFHWRLTFLGYLHRDIVLKPGREVSLVSWALHIAYMQYTCTPCIYSGIYYIFGCTIWDLGQQILRYLAASGLLQVQSQGRVIGQTHLPSWCILYVLWVMYCFCIAHGALWRFDRFALLPDITPALAWPACLWLNCLYCKPMFSCCLTGRYFHCS